MLPNVSYRYDSLTMLVLIFSFNNEFIQILFMECLSTLIKGYVFNYFKYL